MGHEPALLRWLGRAIDWSVAAAGAFMIGLVFYNVLSRYLLKTDVSWSSELCTLLLIWMTFVGGAMATRRNAHLGVTEFVMGLEPAARRRTDILVLALTALALGLLVWFGTTLTIQSWDNIAIAIKISNGWWYLAMPVGSALMLVFVVHQLIALIRTRHTLDALMRTGPSLDPLDPLDPLVSLAGANPAGRARELK